jgi:hypothetical protein
MSRDSSAKSLPGMAGVSEICVEVINAPLWLSRKGLSSNGFQP